MKLLAFLLTAGGLWAQQFEVATIKPTPHDWNGGRFIRMESGNRFNARNHAVRTLLAAAYDLTPKAVLGGPDWIDSLRWCVEARTSGDRRPTPVQLMSMLRQQLRERFEETFHREKRVMPLCTLTVGKGGSKLKESTLLPDDDRSLINVVYPDRVRLPAKNATMSQFTSLLQMGVLSRPVVDQTGLTPRFDFERQWTPEDSQFGGQGPASWQTEGTKTSLFSACRSNWACGWKRAGVRLRYG